MRIEAVKGATDPQKAWAVMAEWFGKEQRVFGPASVQECIAFKKEA